MVLIFECKKFTYIGNGVGENNEIPYEYLKKNLIALLVSSLFLINFNLGYEIFR